MATFTGPTVTERPTGGDLWFVKHAKGVTVYQDSGGVWGAGRWLDDSFLATCLRAFRGGYTYELDSTEVAELTAAGFSGYVTFSAVYDDADVLFDDLTVTFDEY